MTTITEPHQDWVSTNSSVMIDHCAPGPGVLDPSLRQLWGLRSTPGMWNRKKPTSEPGFPLFRYLLWGNILSVPGVSSILCHCLLLPTPNNTVLINVNVSLASLVYKKKIPKEIHSSKFWTFDKNFKFDQVMKLILKLFWCFCICVCTCVCLGMYVWRPVIDLKCFPQLLSTEWVSF